MCRNWILAEINVINFAEQWLALLFWVPEYAGANNRSYKLVALSPGGIHCFSLSAEQ